MAARAMNMGASLLKPLLADGDNTSAGRVCIGTVRGDLHDIGKNLVKMMMEAKAWRLSIWERTYLLKPMWKQRFPRTARSSAAPRF